MNYASDDQLIAVAQLCKFFDNGDLRINKLSFGAEEISCELCKYWNDDRCVINVFDHVLTSMDQT